jgi:hypothetical protein
LLSLFSSSNIGIQKIKLLILGTPNDTEKRSFEICSKNTWLKAAITVAAGNGVGSAMNQLAQPNDLFVDSHNAIYIADSLNHRIIKWKEGALEGQVVAGGNGRGNQESQLSYPTAVFVDRQENIYIADNENNRIQKWQVNGKSGKTIIGQFGRGDRLNQIDNCWGLYVDKNYNVYVSERSNNRVTKWLQGAQSGQLVVQIQTPISIHVHEKTGDIYVVSYAENSVKQFAADGSLIRQIGKDFLKNPFGAITMNDASTENTYIFIADSGHHRILQMQIDNYDNMKTIAGADDLSGNEQNQFDTPIKVQFDSRGNLLVLDFNNNRVQNFSVEKNACDVTHPVLYLPNNSTSSPNSTVRPYRNAVQQSHNQETSDDTDPFKEKGSPISDHFHPQPSFGENASPTDTDAYKADDDQIWRDSSIYKPQISSFRGGFPFTIPKSPSFPGDFPIEVLKNPSFPDSSSFHIPEIPSIQDISSFHVPESPPFGADSSFHVKEIPSFRIPFGRRG